MDQTPPTSLWYFLIGGGFLGFWVFWGFLAGNPSAEATGWVIWGLFGIVIAAAFYVGRLSSDNVRYGIWIGIGIALGILVGATFTTAEPQFIAFFVTSVGAGLIAAGLPTQRGPSEGMRPTPPPTPQRPAEQPPGNVAATPAQWQRPDQTQGQQQTQGTGQRQEQGTRVYGDEYR